MARVGCEITDAGMSRTLLQRFNDRSAQLRRDLLKRERVYAEAKKRPAEVFELDEFRDWLYKRTAQPGVLVWSCAFCREHLTSEHVSVDHGTPLMAEGRTAFENFVLCCKQCNTRKGAVDALGFKNLRTLVGTWDPRIQANFWRRLVSKPTFWGKKKN